MYWMKQKNQENQLHTLAAKKKPNKQKHCKSKEGLKKSTKSDVQKVNPAGIYLLKCKNKNIGVFIVNFKHISHLVVVFLLLTLNM